jgi:ribosomal-protein-alanine N-acetyltransferase
MIIRPMTLNDLDEIASIESESFLLPWTRDHFKYEINDNPFAFTFVAEQENKILGFIDFWIMFDQATINQIATTTPYRRRGIGEMILSDAIKRMKDGGAAQVSLEVRVSNQIAYNFYLKHGFTLVMEKESYYEDGENAYFMVKKL